MKLRQLQHYLDLIKWRESERRGCDMCEKYARCRYCNRHTPNPCAVAYLKLKEEEKRGNQIALSAGIYPEPELPEKFDPESVARAVAVYEKPKAKPAAKREPLPRASAPAERIPVLTLKVTERGEKSAEDTRLFVLSGENSAQSR